MLSRKSECEPFLVPRCILMSPPLKAPQAVRVNFETQSFKGSENSSFDRKPHSKLHNPLHFHLKIRADMSSCQIRQEYWDCPT